MSERDHVVGEPIVRHRQHAVVVHFEAGELGIVVEVAGMLIYAIFAVFEFMLGGTEPESKLRPR